MLASNTSQRQEQPRRSDPPNFVPEPRQERPENSRLRALAQRIPRLNPIATTSAGSQTPTDFRVIQWSDSRSRAWDNDYVLRLPVLDLSRVNGNRVMNPSPGQSNNSEGFVNNPRPHDDEVDAD